MFYTPWKKKTNKENNASCVMKDKSVGQQSASISATLVDGQPTTKAVSVSLNIHERKNKERDKRVKTGQEEEEEQNQWIGILW